VRRVLCWQTEHISCLSTGLTLRVYRFVNIQIKLNSLQNAIMPLPGDSFFRRSDRSKLSNFILNTLNKMHPTSMWLVDYEDLPSVFMFGLTLVYVTSFWIVFMYFCVTSYIDGRTSSFISLQEDAGDCKEVISFMSKYICYNLLCAGSVCSFCKLQTG
jgi:hypothetical protein